MRWGRCLIIIFSEKGVTAAESNGIFVAISSCSLSHVHCSPYCSYLLYGCHCRWNWMLLWLPPKTEVGPLCLQINKMDTDIKFSGRQVCAVKIHENHAPGIIMSLRGHKIYWQIWNIFLFCLWTVLQECAHRCKVHGGTMEQHTHFLVIHYRCHAGLIPNTSTWGHTSPTYE